MAVEIKMPQLSDTMDAGKIVSWNKAIGDQVKRGDILAEVETDKANLEIESFHQGVLLEIRTPAEQTAKVGQVIAVVGEPGEKPAPSNAPAGANGSSASGAPDAGRGAARPEPVAATGVAPREAPSSVAAGGAERDRGAAAPPVAEPPVTESRTPDADAPAPSERVKASPLARKIAEQSGIPLGSVAGSGPNGRIVKRDVEAAREGRREPDGDAVRRPESGPAPEREPTRGPVEEPAPPASPRGPADVGAGSLTPMSRMRETIARRMQQSVRESPHFYMTTTVDMDAAVSLRETLKGRPEFKGISINHLVLKAVAYGISKERRVNRAVREGMIYDPAEINVGIITALDDGLLIPVVKEADRLSLKDLVFEARAAVDRARAGRPSPGDLVGGTFSVSNMGMFDVENFTAVINPGQGSVLAVSSVKEEPVVRGGTVTVGKRMKVTVSVDHRIIDGVMAGSFLKAFKEALESPALMMI